MANKNAELKRSPSSPAGPQARALDLLAEDIRRHHKEVERHASAMVAAAGAAGEKLLEAKDQLKHGEFGPFLTYCGVNARTARVYMRLARNAADAAVLEASSIRAALDAIAGPSPRPKQLSFGPPAEPSYANDLMWQTTMWAMAMLAEGRPAEELRNDPLVRWCRQCEQLDPLGVHTCWRATLEDEA